MKKLTLSAILSLLLVFSLSIIGCSSRDSNVVQEKIIACELITVDYIKNKFPGSTGINTNSKPYGPEVCVFNFKVANKKYYIKFEIHDGNSEKALANSIRNLGQLPLEDLGKKAIQDKNIGQVNIWTGKHVFQVNAADGNKYSVELASEIARDFLDKL